ncbi:MAG TPA: fatty acid desaturase, partial [bacterium]
MIGNSSASGDAGVGRGATNDPVERRLKFAGDSAFHNELKRRVDSYFRNTGKRPRDNPAMYIKTAVILGVFAVSYALLAFVIESWWIAVPVAALLGFATAGIGFNIMHDAGHGAYSRFHAINRMLSWTLDLIGGSSYFWRWKHGVYHHTYANITLLDTDVEVAGLGRLTPHQPWHHMHRWQHWYIWPLYGVMAIKWHVYDDFRDLWNGRIGEHAVPR